MSQGDMTKPKIIFVLGCPGVGKGTQCSNIAREYGFVHLSAGDLLRDERQKAGSKYGEVINKHMKEGTIVPVKITCELIKTAMEKAENNRFVIDGFPINTDNLEGWKKEMEDKVNLLFVLHLTCPDDACIDRCLQRGLHGSGRPDDNEKTIKKRISTFYNDSMPIINHYQLLGFVKTIDANKPKEEVFSDIKAIFNQIQEII